MSGLRPPTREIKHNVKCATCGKKETLKIVNREIPRGWGYFGKLDINACKTSKYFLEPKDQNHPFINLVKIPNPCYSPNARHVFVEYWECRGCMDKGDGGVDV